MRNTLLILLSVFITACASNPIPRYATKKLTGTWVPVKQELGGNNIARQHFIKQSLSIRDTSYIIIAENDIEGLQQDEGSIYINKNKIDFYGKVGKNKGKHFTAIFKIEKNQLIICYNLAGIGFPESFETIGKPLYFMSTYEYKE
jgi:uncharacterized protein (TIGR03067 family)